MGVEPTTFRSEAMRSNNATYLNIVYWTNRCKWPPTTYFFPFFFKKNCKSFHPSPKSVPGGWKSRGKVYNRYSKKKKIAEFFEIYSCSTSRLYQSGRLVSIIYLFIFLFLMGIKWKPFLFSFYCQIPSQKTSIPDLGLFLSRFTDLADPSSSIFYFWCTENWTSNSILALIFILQKTLFVFKDHRP